MKCKNQSTKTQADIAYERAVETCERIIAELDKELEKCTVLATTEIM